MGMLLGSGGRPKAEINLTPMIDVLLVLIIIFLVITPVPPRGFDALIPQLPTDHTAAPQSPIVITLRGDGTFLLNHERLDLDGLRSRLVRLFQHGAKQVIFLRAEKGLEFARIAEVIDMARGVGVDRVGLMTN